MWSESHATDLGRFNSSLKSKRKLGSFAADFRDSEMLIGMVRRAATLRAHLRCMLSNMRTSRLITVPRPQQARTHVRFHLHVQAASLHLLTLYRCTMSSPSCRSGSRQRPPPLPICRWWLLHGACLAAVRDRVQATTATPCHASHPYGDESPSRLPRPPRALPRLPPSRRLGHRRPLAGRCWADCEGSCVLFAGAATARNP